MQAQVGDQLIIDGPARNRSARIGTIIALANHDGSPPYLVRWLAGYESLVYPGPDVRIARDHRYRAGTPAGA